MIAIIRQQIITRAQKTSTNLRDHGVQVAGGQMAYAAEVGEPECDDGGVFVAGEDVVDACLGWDGVPAEGVFAV